MTFELLPVMDRMINLYQQPRTQERFRQYLQLLHGGTNAAIELPISGYNPMGKEEVLNKLLELKSLNAESIIADTLKKINAASQHQKSAQVFKVSLSLSDDLHGGWTNRYTSDYDSKFRLSGLIARHFCTPVFWMTEAYDAAIIKTRPLEYCYRTKFRLAHPKPDTLEAHIDQEQYVAKSVQAAHKAEIDFDALDHFYHAHKERTDYVIIFNFLYGDAATASLGNVPLGIPEAFAGYKFAACLAEGHP